MAMGTPSNTTQTYIASPKHKLTLRIIWLVVASLAVGTYLTGLPKFHDVLLTSPNWAVGYADVLAELGISARAFTLYFMGVNLIALFMALMFSGVIFFTRSDDWLALLVSLTVIMASTSMPPPIHYSNPILGSLFIGIATSLLYSSLLLFPDGKFVPSWSKYSLVIFVPWFLFTGQFISQLQAGQQLSTLQLALGTLGNGASFLGIAAQIYRYRHVANSMQRQQTKYLVLAGIAIFFISMIFVASQLYPPFRTPVFFPDSENFTVASFVVLVIAAPMMIIALDLLPISFGFAVIRYRLWNIDIVVNRGIVYALQTFAITVIFGLGFFLLQTLLKVALGGEQDTLAAVISTGIAVALFNPVRKFARRNVDRYVFGLRFDLDQLEAVHAIPDITHSGKLSGTKLGDYDVLDVIGKGGMGEVYKCAKDGQIFAAKILLPEFASNDEMLTRFQREAQSGMELIEHRNIANIYAVGESDGIHYMVMEFIEGEDLSKIIQIDGKLDSETSIQITKNICSALQAAHDHDYVHRDIKPSNIMLRENGEAVLMDFGIMKMQDATTGITGTGAIGTIDYMAPEQITAAKTVDHRADIYALGVMLYEMLTGEKPFIGGPAQVMFAHLQQPVPDVREKDASIPFELAEAIDKAMAKDPDARFQSASEFGEAIV